MTRQRRPAPGDAPSGLSWALRTGLGVVMVAAVAFAVGQGARWVDQQSTAASVQAAAAREQACDTEAFRRTLDERSQATDDLIAAVERLNREVADGEPDARETFSAEVARIKAARATARAATEDYREESGCA